MTLSWTASTDNVGVTRYNVHRSTTAGFTPSAANRIAQPTGNGLHGRALPAGTYYYKVTAEDLAGNIGPASNQASATVAGGPPVAAYGFDEGAGTAAADGPGTATTARSRTPPGQGRRGEVRQRALVQRLERSGRRSPTRTRST